MRYEGIVQLAVEEALGGYTVTINSDDSRIHWTVDISVTINIADGTNMQINSGSDLIALGVVSHVESIEITFTGPAQTTIFEPPENYTMEQTGSMFQRTEIYTLSGNITLLHLRN